MLSKSGTRFLVPTALVLLAMVVFAGAPRAVAQDATPSAVQDQGRPAHIHSGNCQELGDVVQPLTNLTAPSDGDTVGQASAQQAEYSYTLVPMSLDDMVADDYAINVHESTDNIGHYIACGDIGGLVDTNGQLVIGLGELNNSGFTGIAFLTANANDPNATDVSVFITSSSENGADNGNSTGNGTGGTDENNEATPSA
jgi:hypothetical protein